jgi:hypothetical protein
MQAGSGWRFCVHTYYGGSRYTQMLAGLFLWFSVLCFSFTNPGRKELREREEKRKKKRKKSSRSAGAP